MIFFDKILPSQVFKNHRIFAQEWLVSTCFMKFIKLYISTFIEQNQNQQEVRSVART